jgi:hypothetical protein
MSTLHFRFVSWGDKDYLLTLQNSIILNDTFGHNDLDVQIHTMNLNFYTELQS